MFRFVLKIYMLWCLCKLKKKAISKALLLVNRQLLFRFVLKKCCGNYVKVLKRVNNNHYILFTGGSRGQNSTENLIIHVYLWYYDNLLAFLCSWWWNSLGENTIALSTQSCCECLQRGWVPFSSALDITEWCIISLNHPTNSLEKAMKFLWNSMIWNSYKTWQGHPVLGSVDKWAQLILSYSIFLFILRLNSNCMKHYHLPIVSEWIGWNKCRL